MPDSLEPQTWHAPPVHQPNPKARENDATNDPAHKLAEECEAGSASVCLDLGQRYEKGDGVAQDDARAAAFYGKACDGGQMEGCFQLAIQLEEGRGASKDPERAKSLYKTACDGSEPRACINLYSDACDRGDGTSCYELAKRYLNGIAVGQNLGQAVNLFAKACEAGHAASCSEAAVGYDRAIGVSEDPSRAAELYAKCCDLGSFQCCQALEELYEKGRVEQDKKRRGELKKRLGEFYNKDCDSQDAIACFLIGLAYDKGDYGLPKNPSRATAYHTKSCDLGYGQACGALAGFIEGRAGPTDPKRRAELYRQACYANIPFMGGCNDLGVMYVKGKGVQRDIREARILFGRACQGGEELGCENLRTMNEPWR